jgi:hypothetical protein
LIARKKGSEKVEGEGEGEGVEEGDEESRREMDERLVESERSEGPKRDGSIALEQRRRLGFRI